MVKVSVITPVYNAEKFISEVLESVCNSNFDDFEYLVINDGSTDNSRQVIEDFRQRSTKDFKIIDIPNSGEANAVNTAYQQSSGELVLIVNADDPINPFLIKSLVAEFELDSSISVAYPDWDMIDEFGELIQNIQTLEFSNEALSVTLFAFQDREQCLKENFYLENFQETQSLSTCPIMNYG